MTENVQAPSPVEPAPVACVEPSGPSMALPGEEPSPGQRLAGKVVIGLALLLLFAPPFLLPGDTFRLGLFAKFLALTILALSIDLVWGYTGLLTLGQGLFFGLGAYMVAYSLTLQQAAADKGVPVGVAPPQFMQYTGPAPNDPSYVVPPALAIIAPLGNIWVALAAAVVLPTLVAALFGWVTFRLRIKGVYFALVTQALLLACFTLVRNQQRFTGGVVGIKDLAELKLFGQTFNLYQHIGALIFLIAGVASACFLLCAWLVGTRFGKTLLAIRDNENRVLALGYHTALYKTFLFALAGGLAGLAGGLYVATNELCGPTYVSVAFSIEAVIWVAVGGRGTLVGAMVGTLLIGFAQSEISSAIPDYWPIVLGLLFIVVVVFLPRGLTPLAGPGSLLGILLGIVAVAYLRPTLLADLPGPLRGLLSSLLLLVMIFVPGVLMGVVSRVVGGRKAALARPPAARH